jgi:ABC-type transporter Mla MlaB component
VQASYRITQTPHANEPAVTLLLNGRFNEEAISELDQSIGEAREARRRVYIDLSEVTLVDRKAVAYFAEQAERDVKLVNCPVYLRRWIGEVSDENDL